MECVGAGVESMTNGFSSREPLKVSEEVLANKDAKDCLLPMGITSENVAADYHIPRAIQDEFAAKSFQKAAAAQKAGKFKDEILPIKAKWVDPKTEKEIEVLVDSDDGVRDGVTKESLSKLKPAFIKEGSTHAGEYFRIVASRSWFRIPSARFLDLRAVQRAPCSVARRRHHHLPCSYLRSSFLMSATRYVTSITSLYSTHRHSCPLRSLPHPFTLTKASSTLSSHSFSSLTFSPSLEHPANTVASRKRLPSV